MLRRERGRRVEVRPPARAGLPRQAVDQVEAQVVEARAARGVNGGGGVGGGVDAPRGAQLAVVGGLHPQREAVEARVAQCAQGVPVPRALGVCLRRDFRVRRDGVVPRHNVQQRGKARRAEVARRSSAEVDRVRDVLRRHGRGASERRRQRGGVAVHVRLAVREGVEVAVGALRLAERYVDVQAQRFHNADHCTRFCARAQVPGIKCVDLAKLTEKEAIVWK